MSLTLQKLSQIRKKMKEKEEFAKWQLLWPRRGWNVPPPFGLRHFWNEHLWITKLGECASQCSGWNHKAHRNTFPTGQERQTSKHGDCLKTARQGLARAFRIRRLRWTKIFRGTRSYKSMGSTYFTMLRKETWFMVNTDWLEWELWAS